MMARWWIRGSVLQVLSIVVALLVASAGCGTLIAVAWDSYTGWHGAYYPRDVIEPVVGALLVLALAALIAAPVRFYRIPLVNMTGKILGIFLAIAGMLMAVLVIPLYNSDIDEISTTPLAIVLGLAAFLAIASAAIMLLKANQLGKA